MALGWEADILAYVGNSGATNFPHLHFTMMDMHSNSIKCRFHYEEKQIKTWKTVKGEFPKEGKYVRNIKKSEKSK